MQLLEQQINITVPLSVRFDEIIDDTVVQDKTIILLHGYGESKERIFKTLGAHLAGIARRLIILNAPFPLPYLSKSGYKEGYSWYFRSLQYNLTLIPPEVCEPLFTKFVQTAGLTKSPVSIIGFSQGGFIMPYLAQQIPNLDKLIGISCGINFDSWYREHKPNLHIIHADNDNLSSIEHAEEQFLDLGFDKSKFYTVAGGHEIDTVKIEIVKRLIQE
jgi:predicted esterase